MEDPRWEDLWSAQSAPQLYGNPSVSLGQSDPICWVSRFNQKYQPEKGNLNHYLPVPMTDPNGAGIYAVPWIPSRLTPVMLAYIHIHIYIYLPYMDPMGTEKWPTFFLRLEFHGFFLQIFGTGTLFQSPARAPAVPVLRRETTWKWWGELRYGIFIDTIPMTDPWCWYIYVYMLTWLGYIDGKC